VGSLLDALARPLRQRRSRLNQPDGYWMLGIDPRAAEHMAQYVVALDGPTTVLLASDGLWRLIDHFHVYDAAGLIAASCGAVPAEPSATARKPATCESTLAGR
jgi:hypothetical protein